MEQRLGTRAGCHVLHRMAVAARADDGYRVAMTTTVHAVVFVTASFVPTYSSIRPIDFLFLHVFPKIFLTNPIFVLSIKWK